jgi:membrane-bound metal-dependent hydrolase YbcI (DUF457 family)
MRRALAALGCLATIGAADYVLKRRKPRWILVGLFDHPAHVATAGLLAVNVTNRPSRWTAGFLAGSLLPDLDHLPLLLREQHPTTDDPRPVTHCLLAIAPVAIAAGLTQSERLHGTAAGMAAHFARDLGVGSGVPLLWPVTSRSVRMPYAAYALACAALAGWAFTKVVRSAHA